MDQDQSFVAQSPFNHEVPAKTMIEATHAIPALTFDPNEYAKHVQQYDLTEAQQAELLQALWSIVVAFVDLGFGLHPLQQLFDTKALAADSASMLASTRNSINDQTASAHGSNAPKAEREDS